MKPPDLNTKHFFGVGEMARKFFWSDLDAVPPGEWTCSRGALLYPPWLPQDLIGLRANVEDHPAMAQSSMMMNRGPRRKRCIFQKAMAFDRSYDLLTDLRQLILRRLSVFRRRLRPFVGNIIDNSWNRHYIGGSISWDPEIAADGLGGISPRKSALPRC
jgi:hypothetical protein